MTAVICGEDDEAAEMSPPALKTPSALTAWRRGNARHRQGDPAYPEPTPGICSRAALASLLARHGFGLTAVNEII